MTLDCSLNPWSALGDIEPPRLGEPCVATNARESIQAVTVKWFVIDMETDK